MKIKVLSSAIEDLYGGRLFYEKQGEGLGEYFFDSLFSDIDSLVLYGGVHIKVFGNHRMLSKRFPYAIYYKCPKGEVGYHGIKITVIKEQDQSFNNTESSDNNIDCFSHCNTGFSKASIILSTLNGDIVSADLTKWESAKEVFGSFVILIGSETLKNLCENQIPNDDGNFRQIGVKQVCLPRGDTVEIIDPYG